MLYLHQYRRKQDVNLSDLENQFQQNHDLPLLIRNLLVCLDITPSIKSEVKRRFGISLYSTTNKNLPYYGWWDFNDIVKVLEILTNCGKSECSRELNRCVSSYAKSPAEIHVKTFNLGIHAKVRNRRMVRTNSPLDRVTGKRPLFKRCEYTKNIILCE